MKYLRFPTNNTKLHINLNNEMDYDWGISFIPQARHQNNCLICVRHFLILL